MNLVFEQNDTTEENSISVQMSEKETGGWIFVTVPRELNFLLQKVHEREEHVEQ